MLTGILNQNHRFVHNVASEFLAPAASVITSPGLSEPLVILWSRALKLDLSELLRQSCREIG
jgi:molybdopterin-guanine dinucleotide biosynthesis protein A